MSEFLTTPFFGVAITLLAFQLGLYVQKKLKSPLANPLAIAVILVIATLQICKIPLASYKVGADFIALFVVPATAALAVSIYTKRALLRKYWLPIIAGCAAGSLASIGSVFLLCRLFGLNEQLTSSLIPKSVTTPIAMDLSAQLGGTPSITVVAVIVTGILGAICAPILIKLFRVKNPIARGIAIGTSSHAVGTTRAIAIGEIEGAMSGIAIAIAGISTVLICLFLK